jgi:hypothetical protein
MEGFSKNPAGSELDSGTPLLEEAYYLWILNTKNAYYW